MAKKEKIIIVSHAMELGGAERSLLGLLEALDPEICDIDLFLLRHEGELMQYIPTYIRLLPQIPQYTVLARPMKQTLKEGHLLLTAARCYGKFKAGNYNRKHGLSASDTSLEYSHKYTYKLMPAIEPDCNYDLAISFLTPHYITANKIRAKKKLAWIHTDYSQISIDVESERNMWGAFDYIASISDSVSEAFKKVFPELSHKLVLIENILPVTLIHKQSQESVSDFEKNSDTKVNILSIGRYCTAKNFDNVPAICSELETFNIDFTWYIIGFGPDEKLIREKILESDMGHRIKLLGKKSNPYPYIKKCDFYIQPSRYEGKSVTVREAQLLNKPVIITRYPTSASQLKDGYDGVIVELNNSDCATGIAKLINDTDKVSQLINNCKISDYSNKNEVEKIYHLLEEAADSDEN